MLVLSELADSIAGFGSMHKSSTLIASSGYGTVLVGGRCLNEST